MNPVNGAVGLLWTGNWQVCQTAVETVLSGGALGPLAESATGGGACSPVGRHGPKRKPADDEDDDEEGEECAVSPDLGLRMTPVKRRAATPSEEENYSETTTLGSSSSSLDNFEFNNNISFGGSEARKVLRLFV